MMTKVLKKRKREYKPMAFDTAVRNPERIRGFIQILLPYEGRVLDENTILNILLDYYHEGIALTQIVNKDEELDRKQLMERIIKKCSSRNSDFGYPKGFPARFGTYMRTPSEFGLVFARYGKELKISSLAKEYLNDRIDTLTVFSLAWMINNRKSPYRRVLNNFNFLNFIIKVLKIKKRLSYEQFKIAILSDDGNVDDFIKTIENNSFSNDDEVYEYYLQIQTDRGQQILKKDTVTTDYPDCVLRHINITNLIQTRYIGKVFIELNHSMEDYIDDLLTLLCKFREDELEDEELYFLKITKHIPQLLNFSAKYSIKTINPNESTIKIKKIIEDYNLTREKIIQIIQSISNSGKNNRTDEIFKYITQNAPTQYEFYIALLIYLYYGDEFYIKPNYKMDDSGLPITFASAYKGDIEVYSHDKNTYWLVEVTLIRNRQQQLNSETTSVIRHWKNQKEYSEKRYLSFIAPIIHEDTSRFYENSINECKVNEFLKYFTTDNFIESIKTKNIFNDTEMYTYKTIESAYERLGNRLKLSK